MKLNNENTFKIRAFEKAIGILEETPQWIAMLEEGRITELAGIGKGLEETLIEFTLEGKERLKLDLEAALPEGLMELTRIPGLGPKKALVIIDELGVKSITELEYACRENRLIILKGFGEKAQEKILEQIQFIQANQGKLRLV